MPQKHKNTKNIFLHAWIFLYFLIMQKVQKTENDPEVRVMSEG